MPEQFEPEDQGQEVAESKDELKFEVDGQEFRVIIGEQGESGGYAWVEAFIPKEFYKEAILKGFNEQIVKAGKRPQQFYYESNGKLSALFLK